MKVRLCVVYLFSRYQITTKLFVTSVNTQLELFNATNITQKIVESQQQYIAKIHLLFYMNVYLKFYSPNGNFFIKCNTN